MTRSIECPACESGFEVQVDERDSQVRCPHCQHEFTTADCVGSIAQPAKVELPIRAPKRLRDRQPETSVAPATTPPDDSSPTVIGRRSANGKAVVPRPAAVKNAAARRWVWGLSALAVVVVAIAGSVFYRQFIAPRSIVKSEAADKNEAASERDDASPDRVDLSTTAGGGPDLAADAHQVRDELEALKFLSKQQYFELWSKVYPHVVALRIETPEGTSVAGGVIIDSRGWVATSWRAVRDARRVEVSTAAKSFNTGASWGDLKDDSRGLLAEDPAHDLAIIEVNRRLVTAFANVPLAESEMILGGDRVFGVAPPGDDARIWIFDCPIRDAKKTDNAPAWVRDVVHENQLDESDQSNWIIHGADLGRIVPGSPIFTQAGAFVGLFTPWNDGQAGMAITCRPIQQLANHIAGAARRFPLGPRAQAAAQVADNLQGNLVLAQAISDPRPANLVQKLQTLQSIGLFAKSLEQYQAVKDFAQMLVDLDQAIESGEIPADQRQKITELVDQQMEDLDALLRLNWPQVQFDIGEFNQLAWDSMEEVPTGFIAAARVARSGLSAPVINQSPTVIFQLMGLDNYVITPVTRNPELFLPGSRWLLVGTTDPHRAPWVATEPTEIAAKWCRILYVFKIGDD